MAAHMSLAQIEHDRGCNCVNSSDDSVSEGQCHLSARGITRYDATFSACLIFSPEAEPLGPRYAKQIIPPTIKRGLVSSAGTPGLNIHLCLLRLRVKKERK